MIKLAVAGSLAALALAVSAIDPEPQRAALISPYPRADAIAAALPLPGRTRPSCPSAPPAVRDVVTVSKFGENRRAHDSTLVDDDAAEAYARDTQAVTAFSRKVSAMADSFTENSGRGSRDAHCALAWLNSWAEQDALLGRFNDTGEAVRKWELATLATAYLRIRSAPLDRDQAARVQLWLDRVARAVRNDYARDPARDSRLNNHLNWAAWAVMAAAIAADDRELFAWSRDRYRLALRQVRPDGTLPLELKRRQLAANYHTFALAPLVMLREGLLTNGVTPSADEEARLSRLAGLVLVTLSDPQQMAALSGFSQDMSRITPTHLAWLEPYYARSHDPRALPWLERYRPLSFSRLGGNLTVQFGPATPPASRPPTLRAQGTGQAND